MMGVAEIRRLSDEAAYRAAREGRIPLSLWKREDAGHVPFIGDYVPPGWRLATWGETTLRPRNVWSPRPEEPVRFMVDASGWGSPGEPALTFGEFCALAVGARLSWAIVEEGQFQVVMAGFVPAEEPAP